MPLFKEGRDIQYRWNCIEEEWEIIKASFFRQEWDELKAFMATRPLPDQPFVPSEGLMRSLERWAEKNAVYWEMDRRRDEYKQAFADVMAGKLSVKEAESSIPQGGVVEGDPDTKKALIISRVEKWSTEEIAGYFETIKVCYPDQR
jgi:hypothetical protein